MENMAEQMKMKDPEWGKKKNRSWKNKQNDDPRGKYLDSSMRSLPFNCEQKEQTE